MRITSAAFVLLLGPQALAGSNLPAFTDANYQQEIIEASKEKPVVVKYWASWCGPCRRYEPIFATVAKIKGSDFIFGTSDTDENPQLYAMSDGHAIPHTALFLNGKLERSKTGILSEGELIAFLEGKNADPPQVRSRFRSNAKQAALAQGDVFISRKAWRELQAGDEIYGTDPSGHNHSIKVIKVIEARDEVYAVITHVDSDEINGGFKWGHFMNTHQAWSVGGLIRRKGNP